MIADAFLQEILINPKDHDVIATLNLNGDYYENFNEKERLVF